MNNKNDIIKELHKRLKKKLKNRDYCVIRTVEIRDRRKPNKTTKGEGRDIRIKNKW